jgi:hypothetical protein
MAMKKTTVSKMAKDGDSPTLPSNARRDGGVDWRAEMLERIRAIIQQADSEAIEEVKWRKPSNPGGVPVWSREGIICTGETYKNAVKMTFAKGASLEDPAGLFNSSLEGNTRRAIDFHEGDKINEKALKALIRAAAALNVASGGKTAASAKKPKAKTNASPKRSAKKPKST